MSRLDARQARRSAEFSRNRRKLQELSEVGYASRNPLGVYTIKKNISRYNRIVSARAGVGNSKNAL